MNEKSIGNECHKAKYENKNTRNSYFAVIVFAVEWKGQCRGKEADNKHSVNAA